jgi:uncharacterized damage-inducible protein DinB
MDADRQLLLNTLERGRAALAHALAGVDDALAVRIPPAGGWSVLGVVEHLAMAEELLSRRLENATAQAAPLLNPQREEWILHHAGGREQKRQAPEPSHPAGRFANLTETVRALDASRDRTLAWLTAQTADPRTLETTHPAFPGPISCHEVLLLVGMHSVRHAGQIEEIKTALAAAKS